MGKSCNRNNKAAKTHGLSYVREYNIWRNMIRRCENSDDRGWVDYGGRGIRVCERWRASPFAFFADMGKSPAGYSLDRIDVNGNYEPANCRWATRQTQNNNTRRSRRLSLNGRTQSMVDWARDLGVSRAVIFERLKNGWPLERALTSGLTPRRAP